MIELKGVAGAVTAITGFEKGSGKTTFLSHAYSIARHSGPVAIFSIGVDGAQKARERNLPPPEIQVQEGDIVMTTSTLARSSGARFEILEAVPGRSSLGNLFLGRTVRGGSVTVVGANHLSVLAEVIDRVKREHWAVSVLVDGAVNRLTQIQALGEINFAFTAQVDRSNLARVGARVRSLTALASLPLVPEPFEPCLRLTGLVNAETLSALPSDIKRLSIEDFTKVFLEPGELARTLERFDISVRRASRLLCVAVALRDVEKNEFLQVVGPGLEEKLLFNPFQAAS